MSVIVRTPFHKNGSMSEGTVESRGRKGSNDEERDAEKEEEEACDEKQDGNAVG